MLDLGIAKAQDAQKKNPNLSTTIYEAIKEQIIRGELTPGSVLMERTLADSFAVSRTPVREALKRLSQEGWLLWEEHKRAIVSEITEADVREVFALREMIEPFAVRKIITDGQPQVLAGLLVPITNEMEKLSGSPTEFMNKDMEFHTTIVVQLGLTKLIPLWVKIYYDMMRFDVQSMYPKRRPDEIISEHRRLINAFWNGDLEDALDCIYLHFAQIFEAYKVVLHKPGKA